MTTFDQIEKSGTGRPAILVRVDVNGASHGFTDAVQPIAFNGLVHQPVPLKVGEVRTSATVQSDDVNVTLPRDVPLAALVFPTMTRHPMRLEIRQTHVGAEDAPLVFVGTVGAAAMVEERAGMRLTAQNMMYRLTRSGRRRRWQHSCPLVLYGKDCKASIETSKIMAKAMAWVSGNELRTEFAGADANAPWLFRGRNLGQDHQFLIGSRIELAGVRYPTQRVRAIGNPSPTFHFQLLPADYLVIKAALEAMATADRVVAIIPDCDRTMGCCAEIHANIRNHGGCPWIPYETPVHKSYLG